MSRFLFCAALLSSLVWCAGCGGNGAAPVGNNPITGSASNVASITVSGGPANNINIPTVSLTICVPGSTTNCATVAGVLVDTGSTGVRILAAQLAGLTLPQQTDASGNPIAECFQFADGETWGPVQMATVTISGETANNIPIQVIGSATPAIAADVPAACSDLGPTEQTLATFGANGVIGVNNAPLDCGSACGAVTGNPDIYYTCPSSGCTPTTVGLSTQVPNPVTLFATDNNGVIVELPTVSSTGAPSVTGSLVFGIGTESNNALANQTVLTTDAFGDFAATVLNGAALTGFLDTGSNGYFLDNTTEPSLVNCSANPDFFCPSGTENLTAQNQGGNGATSNVNFQVANFDNLSATNAVFNNVAGFSSGIFDWGLPFYLGRNVYFAIDGASTPAGAGPYVAY